MKPWKTYAFELSTTWRWNWPMGINLTLNSLLKALMPTHQNSRRAWGRAGGQAKARTRSDAHPSSSPIPRRAPCLCEGSGCPPACTYITNSSPQTEHNKISHYAYLSVYRSMMVMHVTGSLSLGTALSNSIVCEVSVCNQDNSFSRKVGRDGSQWRFQKQRGSI